MNESLKILIVTDYMEINKSIEYKFSTNNKINVKICIINHDNIELIHHNSYHYILYTNNGLNDFQLSKFIRKIEKRISQSEILNLSNNGIFEISDNRFIIFNDNKDILNINLIENGCINKKIFNFMDMIFFNIKYHIVTGKETILKY